MLRARLNAARALTNLEWVDAQIRDRLQQLDLAEVPALRLYAENQWRRINKVLPELKAIEHSGDVGLTHTIQVSVGSGSH